MQRIQQFFYAKEIFVGNQIRQLLFCVVFQAGSFCKPPEKICVAYPNLEFLKPCRFQCIYHKGKDFRICGHGVVPD